MQNVQSIHHDPARNTVRELAHTFIIIKRSEGLSKTTIRSYISKLRIFIDSPFCPEYMDELVPGLIRMFFDEYKKNHKPSTVHVVYVVLKLFVDWFADEVEWDNNPFKKLKPPKVKPKIIDPVELDTIRTMLQYCNTARQAIILFLLDTGIRSQELLSLSVSDVNMLSGQVTIRSGKGNKSRTTIIGKESKRILKKYLKERKVQSEYLWTTTTGNQLSYSALNSSLKRIAKKAGVPPPTPHDFRRAFCLNMIKSGTDIESLRQMMGHNSLSMLRLYAKLSASDIMVAHSKGGVDKWL